MKYGSSGDVRMLASRHDSSSPEPATGGSCQKSPASRMGTPPNGRVWPVATCSDWSTALSSVLLTIDTSSMTMRLRLRMSSASWQWYVMLPLPNTVSSPSSTAILRPVWMVVPLSNMSAATPAGLEVAWS